jgi:hypothetical protein
MTILTMHAQAIGLRSEFPNGVTDVSRNGIRWRGNLSPDEYARSYAIELSYQRNDPPKVWVRSPDLHVLADRRPLPHVYDQLEQRLCLYVPGRGFWRPDRALCRTIVPWTCYWLRLFEMWLVTNVWHERGVHPDPRGRCASVRDGVVCF